MLKTLISNNCSAGAILSSLHMEFLTPTILLQILPEQYPKFCADIEYYMGSKLRQVKTFTPYEECMLSKMYGKVPDFPIGILDNEILVCFQHYTRYEAAAARWNERSKRWIHGCYPHETGFIFQLRGPEYENEAKEFLKLERPIHKLCLTQNFWVPGSVEFKGEAFEFTENGKQRITEVFDYRRWMIEEGNPIQ